MNTQDSVKIARDGAHIGEWSAVEISQFLASGSIQPTDLFYDAASDAWRPLLPAFHRRCHEYDWVDADSPWYYVLDGQVVGPRTSAEINALNAGGYLKPDTWLCQIRAEKWIQLSEWSESVELSRAASEHAKEAFNKLLSGDKAGAAMSGWKGLRRFWKDSAADAAKWTRHLAIQTDQSGYPGDEKILQHIKEVGLEFTAHKRMEGVNGTVLVVQFADEVEAFLAEEALRKTVVAPSFPVCFDFTDLQIE